MAPKNTLKTAVDDAVRTIIILFTKDRANYRMRVACVHVHPGERDRIEVEGKDMLGGVTWTAIPDGSGLVPSSEWLVRRALWCEFNVWPKVSNNTVTINLGEV